MTENPENPLHAFDSAIGPNDLDRIKTELSALKRGAEEYMKTNPAKKDPYGQLAADVLAYTNRMLNVSPELEREEKQTAIDNERQATEQFNRAMSEEMEKLRKSENTAQNNDQPGLRQLSWI